MKNPNQELALSQETLRLLTYEEPGSPAKNAITNLPICPTCSLALQLRAGQQ